MKLKRTLICMVTCLMCTSMASAFSDVSSEHWAYNAITKMQEKGLVSGYEDGTFKPDNQVKRSEFAIMLVKALGLTNNSEAFEFEDTKEHWAKSYIDIVSRYLTGYKKGDSYYFLPEEMAIREDMAVAVVKAKGFEDENPDLSILDKFSDKDKMSSGLERHIAIAVEHGIMNGNTNGTFNPTGNLTRAEIASLIYNLIKDDESMENTESVVSRGTGTTITTGEGADTSATIHECNVTNGDYIFIDDTRHQIVGKCACGKEVGKIEAHTYIDKKCVCGYKEHNVVQRFIYHNEKQHKIEYYCKDCGEKIKDGSFVEHVYKDNKCIVCEATIKEDNSRYKVNSGSKTMTLYPKENETYSISINWEVKKGSFRQINYKMAVLSDYGIVKDNVVYFENFSKLPDAKNTTPYSAVLYIRTNSGTISETVYKF